MNTILPKISTHFPSHKLSDLVFACAWCPPGSHKKLQGTQDYTHGICEKHKFALLQSYKQRTIQ